MNGIENVARQSKVLGQTTTRKASIAIWEFEARNLKHDFGLGLFGIMERNQIIGGEKKGGEDHPRVVEVFLDCTEDVSGMLERRSKTQASLAEAEENNGELPKEESSRRSSNFFRNTMQRSLFQARTSMQVVKLRAELAAIDKEIHQRKEKFGIDMFDLMESLGKDYEPRDPFVRDLFNSTVREVLIPMTKIMRAEKEINDVRTTGSILISYDEVCHFVNSNPSLWAMLGVNIGISDEKCKEVASRLAMELASGKKGKDTETEAVTWQQFHDFQQHYVKDPKGSQEFFHRSVFAAFDEDCNGVLNSEETDNFLDTFYLTGSIFEGDDRLPEKHELKRLILEKLDEDGDGEFTFDEIRCLISGSASRGDVLQ